MGKFIKENWFKISLLVLIAIALLVFIFLWTSNQNKKEELLNNIKCQEEGLQIYEKEKKELLPPQSYMNPEFKFVKEMNTCLFKGGIFVTDKTSSSFIIFIKDVYTNKELVGYTSITINGENNIYGEKTEYETLENKYFPE